MVLNQETVQLVGWFSAKGEWTLFPTPDFAHYDPYVKQDERKCVSLINATASARSAFGAFDGKKVVVAGFALKYDDLPKGNGPADRLLSKRNFKSEVVENYCLRDFVFAVRTVKVD